MATIYRALVEPLVHEFRRITRGSGERPNADAGLGLALGGGFARGFAHIGVLRVLEENEIPVACIAGTSVGSIIGAAYASGVPVDEMIRICREVRFKDFARWQISRMGLANNARMRDLILRCFNARRFEDLRIPLAVVATDLVSGEPVVYSRGELIDPIRASCAYPGLFEPIQLDGRYLADGGLVAPVPTKAAAVLGARHVLGVSVGFNSWNGAPPSNVFQILSRAISIAQKHRNPSWERFADLLIEPDVHDIDWGDFERADEIIAAGIAAARRALPQILDLVRLPAAAPAGRLAPRAASLAEIA